MGKGRVERRGPDRSLSRVSGNCGSGSRGSESTRGASGLRVFAMVLLVNYPGSGR